MLCVTSQRNTHHRTGGYIALGFCLRFQEPRGSDQGILRDHTAFGGGRGFGFDLHFDLHAYNIVTLSRYSR